MKNKTPSVNQARIDAMANDDDSLVTSDEEVVIVETVVDGDLSVISEVKGTRKKASTMGGAGGGQGKVGKDAR